MPTTATPAVPNAERDLPSTQSAASRRQAPAVTRARDLWGGDAAVKERTTEYLPQAPLESTKNYTARLKRSVFHNFFRRTVEGLSGFVFRKDPVLEEDVPEIIKVQWENIDNAGTHGDVFVRDLFTDALATGHAAILVDFPDTGPRTLRLDEERKAGVRPYWVPLKKEQLWSWRTVLEAGRIIVSQLVVKETTIEPAGKFGEVEVTRYRVFTRDVTPTGVVVAWSLQRVTEDKKVIVDRFGTYPTQVEIPIAEVPTSGRIGLFESDPPLADVAALTIAHYQIWSDGANSIHKTCVPLLFTSGFSLQNADGSPVAIGPDHGINSESPDGDAKYVTHGGESLGSVKQWLDDLKADIGALGLAMLAPQKRAAETLGAKRLDRQGEESMLAVSARGLQDACERALTFHARYLALDSGGSITINRMFDATVLDPQAVQAYVSLVDTLGVPEEEVLEMLKRGGWLRDDADIAAMADLMRGARLAREDARAHAAARIEAQGTGQTLPAAA